MLENNFTLACKKQYNISFSRLTGTKLPNTQDILMNLLESKLKTEFLNLVYDVLFELYSLQTRISYINTVILILYCKAL